MIITNGCTVQTHFRTPQLTQITVSAVSVVSAVFAAFILLLISFSAGDATAQTASDTTPTKLLILGDSLSASYGIPEEAGWVNLLDTHLKKQHENNPENHAAVQVINASISGETTGGALNRFPRILDTNKPDIVLIELGGNDGLRGYPIKKMKENLSQLIELSLAVDAKVMLVAIQIPPNYGKRYTQMFYDTYAQLAQQYGVNVMPFFLENIAVNPELMQADGIHPTAEAQPLILQNVLPYLDKVL